MRTHQSISGALPALYNPDRFMRLLPSPVRVPGTRAAAVEVAAPVPDFQGERVLPEGYGLTILTSPGCAVNPDSMAGAARFEDGVLVAAALRRGDFADQESNSLTRAAGRFPHVRTVKASYIAGVATLMLGDSAAHFIHGSAVRIRTGHGDVPASGDFTVVLEGSPDAGVTYAPIREFTVEYEKGSRPEVIIMGVQPTAVPDVYGPLVFIANLAITARLRALVTGDTGAIASMSILAGSHAAPYWRRATRVQ